MTFEAGSLIMVKYTAKTADGTVIDVSGDAAPDVGTAAPKPQLVSVNDASYPVLPGLNRVLAAAEVDMQQTVVVPPAEAYGERQRNQVKVITARKLGRDADNLGVGDETEVDNKKCVIISMGSGRVRVDFNHKYAGKSITYDFTVVKHLESNEDKVHALLLAAGMALDKMQAGRDSDLDDDLDDLDDDLDAELDDDLDDLDDDLDAELDDDLDDLDDDLDAELDDDLDDLDDDLDAELDDDLDDLDDDLDAELDDDLDDLDDDLDAELDDDLDDLDDDLDAELDDDLDDLDDIDDDLDPSFDPDDVPGQDAPADDNLGLGYGISGNELTVFVPPAMFRSDKLQSKKYVLQADLFKFVPTLETVFFVEAYGNPAHSPPG